MKSKIDPAHKGKYKRVNICSTETEIYIDSKQSWQIVNSNQTTRDLSHGIESSLVTHEFIRGK